MIGYGMIRQQNFFSLLDIYVRECRSCFVENSCKGKQKPLPYHFMAYRQIEQNLSIYHMGIM